jgi:hypothetical protein
MIAAVAVAFGSRRLDVALPDNNAQPQYISEFYTAPSK